MSLKIIPGPQGDPESLRIVDAQTDAEVACLNLFDHGGGHYTVDVIPTVERTGSAMLFSFRRAVEHSEGRQRHRLSYGDVRPEAGEAERRYGSPVAVLIDPLTGRAARQDPHAGAPATDQEEMDGERH